MKYETQLRASLAASLLISIILMFFYFQQDDEYRVYRLTQEKTIDSLRGELFNEQVQLGRYEITLDHLQEVNPKAALEFVNYMNHETE